MNTPVEAPENVKALAEVWASIDGKLDKFRLGKRAEELELGALGGAYSGYIAEAEELIKRLRKRGFDVVSISAGNITLSMHESELDAPDVSVGEKA